MLDCNDVYNKLRASLFDYARQLQSFQLETFAIEMELIPGTTDSADPALLDEFLKACPGSMTLGEAYAIAAAYLERELVQLRHVGAAARIVEDLRSASTDPQSVAPPLRLWSE
jgi:hypothetical protein